MSAIARVVLQVPPTTAAATAFSQTRIDVTWSVVIGAVSYKLYRNGTLVETTSGTSHSSTNLSAGTLYSYQIACVDADGREGPKGSQFSAVTFAAPDTLAPTVPVIAVVTTSSTTQTVSLTTPSTDVSGVASYTLQRATNSGFTANLVTVTLTAADFPYDVTGLSPGTTYFYRCRATDTVGNTSQFSATVSAATQAAQTFTAWFPNWPVMNFNCVQGNVSENLLDSAQHDKLADLDAFIIQSFKPNATRNQSRVQNIRAVRAIRNQGRAPRVLVYAGVQQTLKVWPADSALDIAAELIADSVEGNPNWYIHRVPPNQSQIVEPNFGQTQNRQINMGVFVSGLNSLGENYVEVLWRKWAVLYNDSTWNVKAEIDGFFQDNYNARPPAMWVNNGATEILDYDMNNDGVAEIRNDFGSGSQAGGKFWADGHLESKAQMEANFPGFLLIPNSAQWDSDYFDGDGDPPMPLSQHPFYGRFDVILNETVNNNLGITKTSTTYQVSGGSVQTAMRAMAIQERMLRPDSQNDITGKGCVLLHANTIGRTPQTSADYAFARFMAGLALLGERWAPCIQEAGETPLSLDELMLELGAPVATRSMGTLNESASGGPSFTMRTANFSSGVARFYWAQFEKGLVLVRTDNPTTGVYPSADAAVACTLPTPPTGKKWQRINAATYVNPITGRSMRGQDTTLNNGTDTGASVSLKPYHAIFLRLV